jgi:redox-sensitive bicupin YhaK (pirin superfamily)
MQIWVTPERPGLTPGYEQKQFTTEERTGKLLPIVSGHDEPGTLKIHQDTTFYVGRLNAGDEVSYALKAGRRAFLYVIEGAVRLGKDDLFAGDQARITESGELVLTAQQTSEVILLDLP